MFVIVAINSRAICNGNLLKPWFRPITTHFLLTRNVAEDGSCLLNLSFNGDLKQPIITFEAIQMIWNIYIYNHQLHITCFKIHAAVMIMPLACEQFEENTSSRIRHTYISLLSKEMMDVTKGKGGVCSKPQMSPHALLSLICNQIIWLKCLVPNHSHVTSMTLHPISSLHSTLHFSNRGKTAVTIPPTHPQLETR